MKKLSVSEAVLDCVKTKGAITTKQIVQSVPKPSKQVYTAVWKLTQAGKLGKTGKLVYLKTNMPIFKPDVPMVVDHTVYDGEAYKQVANTITKRKATGLEMSMGKKISVLEKEVESLKRDLTQMSVNYYDALAVIKYLENKVKG